MKAMVVGVGNDFRGDDGAGLAVVRSLGMRPLEDVGIVELKDDVTGLLDHLHECDTAIIIDAVKAGDQPGTIHSFDASHKALPASHTRQSTHGISIGSLLELARLQGKLPRRIVVYGIEGEQFEHNSRLTPQVELAVNRVADLVRVDLVALEGCRTSARHLEEQQDDL